MHPPIAELKQHHFQFSLRTLVLIVVGCALVFAFWRTYAPEGGDAIAVMEIIGFAVQGAMWLLLIGFGIWAFRRLQLPSLPWLALYAACAIPWHLFRPLLVRAVVSRGSLPSGWSPGELVVTWTYAHLVVQNVIALVLTIMILAEVIVLIPHKSGALDGRPFGPLRAARKHTSLLGMVLVALTLAEPCAAIFWLWIA